MKYDDTDSLIFDLDGTLWDASETCALAWSELLKKMDLTEYAVDAAVIRSISGLPIQRVFSEHFTFIPEERRTELLEGYKPMELEYMKKWGGKLYPRVREVLQQLRQRYKLFVVSNCLPGYIENFIEFNKLDGIFDDFECSGNTGKPKSDNIKMIVSRNQLKDPVYIGDTVWDLESATAAGVPFIYAAYGFGKIEEAGTSIGAFGELENIFGG